ncbi:MAG: hypothetical protein ACM3SM_08750 [Bacteroidota bacterium]
MISALVFFIHLVFVTVVFTKKWQTESITAAATNLALIIILFSVGWSITGMIAKLVMEKEGFGLYFDRDTFSLVLLTIGEYFFYRMYYSEKTAE